MVIHDIEWLKMARVDGQCTAGWLFNNGLEAGILSRWLPFSGR
jgi:hypothetical protein